jgi:hypothetical protein
MFEIINYGTTNIFVIKSSKSRKQMNEQKLFKRNDIPICQFSLVYQFIASELVL